MRVPTPGAAVSLARRISIALVASWTTIRRPVASSNAAGAVTTASIATSRSLIASALAMETALRADGSMKVVIEPHRDK